MSDHIKKLTDTQLLQRVEKINERYKPLKKYYFEITDVRNRLLNEAYKRGLKC